LALSAAQEVTLVSATEGVTMARQTRLQQGITRIEILVIIIILGFVVAFIFIIRPIVYESHVLKASVCGSNLRQIGQALRIYAMDYGGYYPPLIQPPDQPLSSKTKTMSPWYYILIQKYGLDERLFHCDLDKNYDPSRKFPNLDAKLRYMSDNISYGLNYDVKFADGTPYRVMPNGEFVDATGRPRTPSGPDRYPDYYKADEIEDPRTFIVVAERNSEHVGILNFAVSIPMDESSGRVGGRHKAIGRPAANVVFADDHVELWATVTPSPDSPSDARKDINQPINHRYWTLAGD
jgi:type II secretory pathway pseudopilin PulG